MDLLIKNIEEIDGRYKIKSSDGKMCLKITKEAAKILSNSGTAVVMQGVSQPVQTAGLHIGDMVRVSSTAECYSDWKDLEAEVIGIIKRPNGNLDYTIKDGVCEYDGFDDADLIKMS